MKSQPDSSTHRATAGGSAAAEPVRDAPAFDFYPERWLVGVAGMSDAEQLAYLRLLCHQWLLGDAGLPEDVPALKRLGGGKGVTPAVLAKLPQSADGKRRNARLEIIRAEQRERIATKSRQRRDAALKRWHPDAAPPPAKGARARSGSRAEAPALDMMPEYNATAERHAAGMRPHCGSLCETHADDLRTECGSACETYAAAMPTTHLPPPTPVPEAIHPPGGAARVRPTLLQARAAAPELGITPAEAEAWWLAREASEWLRSSNGALMPVGDNWRADAKTFTNNAIQRRHTHANSRTTPARNDSANKPGRYA